MKEKKGVVMERAAAAVGEPGSRGCAQLNVLALAMMEHWTAVIRWGWPHFISWRVGLQACSVPATGVRDGNGRHGSGPNNSRQPSHAVGAGYQL